jgi:hypothetical protein
MRNTLAAVLSIGFAAAALAAYPPTLLNYQGVLRDASDRPLDGSYDMVLRLFSAATGGDEILVDSHPGVAVRGGLFSIQIGGGTVSDGSGPGRYAYLPKVFADYGAVYLEVVVQGEILSPRTRIVSSPYALSARYVNGVEVASSGSLDLYVNTATGDDDNSGVTASAPKRTIQAAVNRIPAVVTGNVTVRIAAGTYQENVLVEHRDVLNDATITLQGDPAAPSNVLLIASNPLHALRLAGVRSIVVDGVEIRSATNSALFVSDSSGVTIRNSVLRLSTNGLFAIRSSVDADSTTITENSGNGLACIAGSRCRLSNVDVISNGTGLDAQRGGRIELIGSARVLSNTWSGGLAFDGGSIDFNDRSDVEVTGNGESLRSSLHGGIWGYRFASIASPPCTTQDYGVCRPDPY